ALQGSDIHLRGHYTATVLSKFKENVLISASKLITELDLSFNALETIMKDDFLSYAALRALFVNNNRIKTIHEDAFHPLIDLEKLDLSSNQLETLSSGWFQNLISLHYLNLLGNKYSTLGQGNLFLPLRSLKTLHFGGPFLQSVTGRKLSGWSRSSSRG
uniref:Toll-like receptor 2 n=1 Tax=Oreochromis niloticus TaxID=8128 RepID=A0A669DCB4_ORENI